MKKSNDPVVVYRAGDFMDAAQIKSELDAAGFLCQMLNAQHTTMLLGGGISIGIRLIVPASQAEEAREFIRNRRNTRVLEEDHDENA